MNELSVDEIKVVSGGHNPSVRQMQEEKHGGVSPSQGHGLGLDKHDHLPETTVHGGWGKGGINANS